MLRRLLLVLVIVGIPVSMLWANEIIDFATADRFDPFSRDQGEDLKGVEPSEEANVPSGAVAVLDDAPWGKVTKVDAAGVAFLNELNAKNLRIRKHMIASSAREERPEDNRGLFALDPNTIVSASNFLEDSIDWNFAEPNRTSAAFDVDPLWVDLPPVIGVQISIFNEQDEAILGGTIDVTSRKKNFFGVGLEQTGRFGTREWTRDLDAGHEYRNTIRIWVPERATFAWLVLGGVSLVKGRRW